MNHFHENNFSSRDWRLNDYQCSRQDRYVGTCSPPESCCKGNLACHYDETYDTGCLIVIGRVSAGFMLTEITHRLREFWTTDTLKRRFILGLLALDMSRVGYDIFSADSTSGVR